MNASSVEESISQNVQLDGIPAVPLEGPTTTTRNSTNSSIYKLLQICEMTPWLNYMQKLSLS